MKRQPKIWIIVEIQPTWYKLEASMQNPLQNAPSIDRDNATGMTFISFYPRGPWVTKWSRPKQVNRIIFKHVKLLLCGMNKTQCAFKGVFVHLHGQMLGRSNLHQTTGTFGIIFSIKVWHKDNPLTDNKWIGIFSLRLLKWENAWYRICHGPCVYPGNYKVNTWQVNQFLF